MEKHDSLEKAQKLDFAFLSPFYFSAAIGYSKVPEGRTGFEPQLHASILFSYFSLESFVYELMYKAGTIPSNLQGLQNTSVADKIKNILGTKAGGEPFCSVRVLENLRHCLIHIFPISEFKSWEENDISHRTAI